MHPTKFVLSAISLATITVFYGSATASAATCRDPAGFEKWLGDIKREARAQGIPAGAINAGLAGVTYDPYVISKDQSQSFNRAGVDYIVSMRLGPAQAALAREAPMLARLERRYGVPGPILVAIWGSESDFGATRNSLSAMRSVATLAYDCRRSALFTKELFAGLRLIARGNMNPVQPVASWAGEMGQTQFMLSSQLKYAVDGDGDGRVDIVGSSADALASTAHYLSAHGWARGGGWQPGTRNYAVLGSWNGSAVYREVVTQLASRAEASAAVAQRQIGPGQAAAFMSVRRARRAASR